jgi:restriction endonuclease S subunit
VIPRGWTERPFSQCGTWLSGGTPSTENPAFWGGDMPWISASSLHSFLIRDSERRVTSLGAVNGTRLVPQGTLLFVVRGMSLKTEFRLGITQRTVAFGQDSKAVIPAAGIDGLFLAYAVKAMDRTILGMVDEASHGTGRLQTEPLQALSIRLPPFAEQQAIASVLGAIDLKIELNRDTNQTLESMAHALFSSWFIDFNNAPKIESDGLPSGWRRGTLAELQAEQPNAITGGPFGSKLVSSDYADSGIPVIRGCNLGGGAGEWFSEDKFVFVSPEKASRDLDSCLARPGDVLFTQRGTLGQVGLIPHDSAHREYVVSQSQMKMTCADGVPPEFVVLAFKRPETLAYIEANGAASGVPHINLGFLRRFPIIIPPRDVLRKFGEKVFSLSLLMRHNVLENRALATTRDELLPRLLSGELRVRDVHSDIGVAC